MNRIKIFIASIIYLLITVSVYIIELQKKFPNTISAILYLVAPLFLVMSSIFAIKIFGFRNRQGKAFFILTFGFFFSLIGEVIFLSFQTIFHKDLYPSLADGFFLLAYIFFFAGFFYEIKSSIISWTTQKTLFLGVSSVIIGGILIYYGILYIFSASLGTTRNIVDIVYGLGYFFILASNIIVLLLATEYQKGKLFLPWLLIFIGMIFICAGNLFFAQFSAQYAEQNSCYKSIDLLWIIGYLFMSNGIYGIINVIYDAQQKLKNKV
jgi:hypothetical protein